MKIHPNNPQKMQNISQNPQQQGDTGKAKDEADAQRKRNEAKKE